MRIALVQTRSVGGEPASNLLSMERTVSGTDADLFVYPELFLCGYDIEGPYRRQAEIIQNGMLKKISNLAVGNDCSIILGAPHLSHDSLHNSLFLFRPDASVDRYDKIHLADFGPFHEKKEFVPGSLPLLVDLGGFRFGMSICYDLFFPELFKQFALRGADALVCISASPCSSRKAFEAVLPARAVENTCYMLFCNSTGAQGSSEFFGGSRVISPIGMTLEEASEEEAVLMIQLDKKEIARARAGRPTMRDSRLDIWPLR